LEIFFIFVISRSCDRNALWI